MLILANYSAVRMMPMLGSLLQLVPLPRRLTLRMLL